MEVVEIAGRKLFVPKVGDTIFRESTKDVFVVARRSYSLENNAIYLFASGDSEGDRIPWEDCKYIPVPGELAAFGDSTTVVEIFEVASRKKNSKGIFLKGTNDKYYPVDACTFFDQEQTITDFIEIAESSFLEMTYQQEIEEFERSIRLVFVNYAHDALCYFWDNLDPKIKEYAQSLPKINLNPSFAEKQKNVVFQYIADGLVRTPTRSILSNIRNLPDLKNESFLLKDCNKTVELDGVKVPFCGNFLVLPKSSRKEVLHQLAVLDFAEDFSGSVIADGQDYPDFFFDD